MPAFDLVIAGGTVVDGLRNPRRVADVVTFEGGVCTGATPGRLLRHGAATA